MKTFVTRLDPYDHEIIVIYDPTDANKCLRVLKKLLKEQYETRVTEQIKTEIEELVKHKTIQACFLHTIPLIIIKRANNKVKLQGNILHEVCHCIFWLMDTIGLPLTSRTEEAYTYPISYLYKEIMYQMTRK